jgi:death on curing protein
MIYLDLDDLLYVAARSVGSPPEVRDYGLLESAVARPQTIVFGQDAYPTLHSKAAALLHSVVKNHALVDGNKRLALGATIAFLGLNGQRLTMSNDEAHDLVIAVASGHLAEVEEIASVLEEASIVR